MSICTGVTHLTDHTCLECSKYPSAISMTSMAKGWGVIDIPVYILGLADDNLQTDDPTRGRPLQQAPYDPSEGTTLHQAPDDPTGGRPFTRFQTTLRGADPSPGSRRPYEGTTVRGPNWARLTTRGNFALGLMLQAEGDITTVRGLGNAWNSVHEAHMARGRPL